MMSAPFGGPPALPFGTANATPARPAAAADTINDDLARLSPPRKYYMRYYSTREANDNMWKATQGVHAFLRAYYHMKSADWTANAPVALKSRTGFQGGLQSYRVGQTPRLNADKPKPQALRPSPAS